MKKSPLVGILSFGLILGLAACGGDSGRDTSLSSNGGSATSESVDSGISESVAPDSSQSVMTELEAKFTEVKKSTEDGEIALDELFEYDENAAISVTSDNSYVVSYADGKLTINHAGDAVVTLAIGEDSASVKVVVRDPSSAFAPLNAIFLEMKDGFILSGIDMTSASALQRNDYFTTSYHYDAVQEKGIARLSDGNMYNIKGTASGYAAYGTSKGSNADWQKETFLDLAVGEDEALKEGNDVLLPATKLGSEEANPVAMALLQELKLTTAFNFTYIRLSSVGDHGFDFNLVTSALGDENETSVINAEVFGTGTATLSSLDEWLETAEIPEAPVADESLLKDAFQKFAESQSYQIYGSDVTDSDHEIFYNRYTPDQYYEYFMQDAFGYVNKDGRVYRYVPDTYDYAVLEDEPYGQYTDYKAFIKTVYTMDLSLLDVCRPDPDEPTLFEYAPELDDRELGRYLLQMVGYDLNRSDGTEIWNYTNSLTDIGFLVDGDVIYVEIYCDYGKISFQFDSLNSASLPIVPGEVDPRDYVGEYAPTSTVSIKDENGDYVDIETSLTLEADLTGTFLFHEATYDITWNPALNESNKNQIDMNLEIVSETTKGEEFLSSYINVANWDFVKGVNIQFRYDANVTFAPSALYKLQEK